MVNGIIFSCTEVGVCGLANWVQRTMAASGNHRNVGRIYSFPSMCQDCMVNSGTRRRRLHNLKRPRKALQEPFQNYCRQQMLTHSPTKY
jgi:hypothetical protein